MMQFLPVSSLFFPLMYVVIIQTIVVFALARDAKQCSRPYICGLLVMELHLIAVLMASFAKVQGSIMFWNMLRLISRYALGPFWLWMALDMNGLALGKLNARRIFALSLIPIGAFGAIMFSNGLFHWYWPRTWFEDGILIVKRNAICTVNTGYCHFIQTVGTLLYMFGTFRHKGQERLRLVIIMIAVFFIALSDDLGSFGLAWSFGTNPLNGFMAVGFCTVGLSSLRYGLPRARSPIAERDVVEAARPKRLLIDRTGTRGAANEPPDAGDIFADIERISERQAAIARSVYAGRSYKQIAADLGIAERTVKYHMGQLIDKLGLETREQLIAWMALRTVAVTSGRQ